MWNALVRASVARRAAVLFLTALFALVGIAVARRTPIEAFPDVTNLQVVVITQVPGLAPEEIERQATVPVERALNGTPGVLVMRSESLAGLSLVTLTFEDGADVFASRTLVAQRLATADLADGIDPFLAPDATPLGEIYQYRLASPRHDLATLRSWQEWHVAPTLRTIPGVADVVSFGGFRREIHVEVDPARLDAHDLSLAEVADAVERTNRNVGGGVVAHGDQQLLVRSVGVLGSAEDLARTVVAERGGVAVTLRDVARLVASHTPRMGTVGMYLDPEAVEGFVILRRGENPSAVLEAVEHAVAALNEGGLPDGMAVEPFFSRSTLVEKTLGTVERSLVEGVLLIVGFIWLFLRTLRGSLVVAIVIPLSLLTAFVGLYALGVPANLISMGAVDFGILVDGAVVLVENVLHEVQHRRPKDRAELLHLVREAAAAVAGPTLFAMTIILVGLLPVFSLERVEGRIFRPLALTYTLALVGALVCALTVVPALAAMLLRPSDADLQTPRWLDRLRDAFGRVLDRALAAPARTAALVVAWLAVAGVVGAGLGREFLPELDEGDVVVFVEMPASVSLEGGRDLLQQVRARLLAFPEVLATMSEHGRPEDGTDNEGVNMSETFVRLKPREAWRPGWDKDRLIRAMRASVEEIPGVRYNFSQPIKDNVEESVSGVRGKVVMKVFGADLEAMRRVLDDAIGVLEQVDGVVELDRYRETTSPQLQIRLDRAALVAAGAEVGEVQDFVETALAGRVLTELWQGDRPVPIRLRLPPFARGDVGGIGALAVRAEDGGRWPLDALAEVGIQPGRASINREAGRRFSALKFNVEGRDVGSVVDDAVKAVKERVQLPEGHEIVWSGEFENQQRAMARLALVVPVSLFLVTLLLYVSLRSGRAAGAILATTPLALTGGVVALALGGEVLSISAAVGFIALLGQMSLLGMLVAQATLEALAEGRPLGVAVREGALRRFRAVLMASTLAMVGLMPMAFGTGVGSETQRPFALVLVGGMVTTLLGALLVLPVVLQALRPTATAPTEEA